MELSLYVVPDDLHAVVRRVHVVLADAIEQLILHGQAHLLPEHKRKSRQHELQHEQEDHQCKVRDQQASALAPAAAAAKEGDDEECGAKCKQQGVSAHQRVLRQQCRVASV